MSSRDIQHEGIPAKEKLHAQGDVGLPNLPKGWCWTTVGELGRIGEQTVLTGPFGSGLGRGDFIASGVPVLTIGCLSEQGLSLAKASYISETKAVELSRYRLKTGDVLFSRMASVGRADIVTSSFEGAIINYHLMRLRLLGDAIDPVFFIHFVRSSETVVQYLQDVNHGATRDGINTIQLLCLPVALAPLAEQQRIVQRLDELFIRLDASVAGLKQLQAKLKRYRAAVLKAAVDGTLTEGWRAQHPDIEPASALLQRILQERRHAWEQAELAKYARAGKMLPMGWQARYQEPLGLDTATLPELPNGWSWVTLDQLLMAPACNGISVKGSSEPPGVPALRLSAMSNTGFNYSVRRYIPITDEVADSLAVKAGDFFISRGNGSLHLVGRGTLADDPGERIVFPDTMIRLRFAALDPLRRFISTIWPSRAVRSQVEQRARTTLESTRFLRQI